jgi:hypothetical protein
VRKVLIAAVAVGLVLTNALSAQAVAVPGGCRLSANWFVTSSANWSGSTFTYGVLNSPGPLVVGGLPDGRHSEWFVFRDNEITFTGVYRSRDETKPASYVYRTETFPGSGSAARNVDKVAQIAVAPSGIWCQINSNRP